MKSYLLFNFKSFLEFNLFFNKNFNYLLIQSKLYILKISLPNLYFIKINKNNNIYLCFINKYYYSTVFKQLFFYLKFLFKIFFFRIKLKGLGYRIKKINKRVYRFFLAYNHYFYFYAPLNIFI